MGRFIRNGIEYSGGGSNEVEISYSDYLALPIEERYNGTVYYITDISNHHNSSNIYYNQEDDIVYLLLPDGTYTPYASGGMIDFNINDTNQITPEDWTIVNSNGATTSDITSEPFSFNLTAGSGSTSWKSVAISKSLRLGSYNKLKFSGSIKGYKNNGSLGNCFEIALINDMTGRADYVWSYTKSPSEAVDISDEITIKLDVTVSYRIRLTIYGYPGWMPSYMKFDSFILSKEVI